MPNVEGGGRGVRGTQPQNHGKPNTIMSPRFSSKKRETIKNPKIAKGSDGDVPVEFETIPLRNAKRQSTPKTLQILSIMALKNKEKWCPIRSLLQTNCA